MTSPTPKGLAAYLETDPQEVERWVEEGQLRLFGATLAYLTSTARTRSEHKVADIKGVLSPLVEQADTKWDTWWSKVQPWVKESEYFKPGEARYTYRLAPGISVDDIPVERLAGKSKSAKSSNPSGVKIVVSEDTTVGELLQQQVDQAAELLQQLAAYNAGMQELRNVHNVALRQFRAELRESRESYTAELQVMRDSHTATMRELRAEMQAQRQSHTAEMQAQRQSHAADAAQQRENHAADLKQHLERWHGEEERLNYQIKSLWASIDSRLEQSRLAARKDMLLRVGDILQRAYHPSNDPETKLNQVIAHLPLALSDGGAELLGEVGEIVAFDPTQHHPSQEIASGDMVRLTAPGVITGSLVILKANVTPVTEET